MASFDQWFQSATGNAPFPYQRRFAEAKEIPQLVDVPTGLGKTAMAVVGWLWRRKHAAKEVQKTTPRRLVYCLPMRVLVEQTRDSAVLWLHKLGLLAGSAELANSDGKETVRSYTLDFGDPKKIAVHVLMGGEDEQDWDIYPEREQVIIGTQDMLLSRALNRGYAATRSRWPIQFGLLHTDCLWVFDEVQLMGAGLATTAQLEAFRRLLPGMDSDEAKNGHGCRSVWMSATLRPEWLKTVDFKDHVNKLAQLELNDDDHRNGDVRARWTAKKPLAKTKVEMGDIAGLADEVRKAHKPGTRTIVIVNTVKRAREVFDAMSKAVGKASSKPALVLLHSRFRPEDRKKQVDKALAEIKPEEPGTIVVSTQVIEAGVDVSATTLFTEVAPWASLVQRFGRCNRRGEANDRAAIHWIPMPTKDADAEKIVAPYEREDLKAAEGQLKKLADVGLKSLPEVPLKFEHKHVIRRKDLIDLFDTTPDLAGNDIDIDRFVRDVEDSDVRVFWRSWDQPKGHEPPPEDFPAPQREELCSAPFDDFRDFAKKLAGKVWRWNFLDSNWERVDTRTIAPGQTFLVHCGAGGYLEDRGWDSSSKTYVGPVISRERTRRGAPDSNESESLSQLGVWQTVAEHTDEVCAELERLLASLNLTDDNADALKYAVRWHDRGKAHEIFKKALPDGVSDPNEIWAKAAGKWKRYERRHFRHELASGLSVLDPRNQNIPDHLRDRVAYLVAAHHGKVRLSIRSLPNESHPHGNRRFARGVWDDDELPVTDLGGGVIAPAVKLSLEPMELGLCEQKPFIGQPSWIERMIRLRDELGPFRLAYLEAILRAADMRASRAAEQRGAGKLNSADVERGKESAHVR